MNDIIFTIILNLKGVLMRKIVLIVLIISIFIVYFFSISKTFSKISGEKSRDEAGIKITDITTGLGSYEKDPELQECTYTLNLINNSNNNIFIKSITPVFSEHFEELLIDDDYEFEINSSIESQGSMLIKDKVVFSMKGMSKADIDKISPYIMGVDIIIKETLIMDK
jgi:hypothetical protein